MKYPKLMASLLTMVAVLPSLELHADTPPASAVASADPFLLPASDAGIPGSGTIRRAPWFQAKWRERRTAWAQSRPHDRGAVVFLGDSITEFWGGGLAAAFPGMHVVNRGISGDTSRGVLLRLGEDVLALDPAAIVLLIGTNDIETHDSPETIVSNVRLTLDAIKAHNPGTPVILCEIFPSSAQVNRPRETIQEINTLLRTSVRGDAQVIFMETWLLFAGPEGDAPIAEFPDLLHLNEAAYAKWAAALRPIFATLGFLDTQPDFTSEEGFVSLFNGHDLTGWGYRRTTEADRAAAHNWWKWQPGVAVWNFIEEPASFDGLRTSPDGRYVAINGRLVVTTPPEYRSITQLFSQRDYPEDFILKLEFRATPNADGGVYVRGTQHQCRDFTLAGPWKDLRNYRPQDWNELVIELRGGLARGTCNGEVLEQAMPVPATGPIGFEGDRGQVEYRRIRMKILPPIPPAG